MAEVFKWAQEARIFYEKKSMAKYISHLDIMQTFSRAIKRARIPVWYTEGFNPRAFLSFSAPLPLGVESFCETCDIRLTEECDFDILCKILDEALPEDIHIKYIDKPVYKASDIAFSKYEIIFNEIEDNDFLYIINKFKDDEIYITKKVKKGRERLVKLVNIKDNIKSCSPDDENPYTLNIILTSGMQNNVNPISLLKSLTSDMTYDMDKADIIKKETFLENMQIFQ